MGFGYDPELLAEKRPPTKQELDAAFPDNPVILVHVSGHGAMLNSKALATYSSHRRHAHAAGRRDRPRARLERAGRPPLRDGLPADLREGARARRRRGDSTLLKAGPGTLPARGHHDGPGRGHDEAPARPAPRPRRPRRASKLDLVALPFITEIDAVFGGQAAARTSPSTATACGSAA